MLLQHTVSRSALQRPDAIAIVDGEDRISYRELDEISNRLARLLLSSGCRPGDRIGVLMPKCIAAIAGILGVLKAGMIYVPMDVASPPLRLRRIVDACEPTLILYSSRGAALWNATLSEAGAQTACRGAWLDTADPPETRPDIAFTWNDCLVGDPLAPPCATEDADAAHILFTSGSTGIPKGVVITHRNVSEFLAWAVPYFGISADDKISGHPPMHFDLSTFDIFGAFLAGAELHLVPPKFSLLPKELAHFIRSHELSQWFSVPSVLKYMAQYDVVAPGSFPHLKRILWCGEALPTSTLIYWMKQLPGVTFTNLYGPTETTIASSYYTLPCRPADDTAEIPIGTGCAGEELLILDESLNPQPPGAIGSLYIRGVGLSPGYWRDQEKTASVFITVNGQRIYRTGDLARLGDDGLVYLLGREDTQIKSRGYRIELGEIEAALYQLGCITECAVVSIPTGGFEGNAICCAYVDAHRNGLSYRDIREQLIRVIPGYMIPDRWLKLDLMPLNANGKIDRPLLRKQFEQELASKAQA